MAEPGVDFKSPGCLLLRFLPQGFSLHLLPFPPSGNCLFLSWLLSLIWLSSPTGPHHCLWPAVGLVPTRSHQLWLARKARTVQIRPPKLVPVAVATGGRSLLRRGCQQQWRWLTGSTMKGSRTCPKMHHLGIRIILSWTQLRKSRFKKSSLPSPYLPKTKA